ncbi:short subunit dehydrogenase [Kribbella sp. VKM Ac-2527]|uniref:Short subunit dehydrogenase n=1 Tax=Kribbella caucasensis TaxID=2512215 RepID=A0A4R6KLG5_9ACTN|nr:SDR family NAD(P)-dependent oxidoreductase [Kribbella sp. VKM Ac-2527]TDO51626.1 short subunit dehydrogenase [Kribbella sp. VKM Ac-2527]
MTTLAIIGAGPGLGAAVAERFGREGFSVALIARNQAKLGELVDSLSTRGITATAYLSDVHDRDALTRALAAAADELGPVEVLQYSPVPRREFLLPLLETTVDELSTAVEFSIYGPVTAVQQVLPGMSELGRGTILFVNGSSAVTPNPKVAGTSVAFAGESAYGQMLHDTLTERNIHVGQLIVPGAIRAADPVFAPEVLADRLWRMHLDKGAYRVTVGPATA